MPFRRFLWLALSLIVGGGELAAQQSASGAGVSGSLEKGLSSIEFDLKTLEEEAAGAEGRYLSPFIVSREYSESPAKKLEKADFYFQRKDYVSAGSLYYSIASGRKEKDVIWEEAQFKLAETLFLSNNYLSASRYYEALLAEKPYSRFQVDALKRLIAAAYHLGEYAKAKTYYNGFLNIGYDVSRDQDLLYFLGKSLFFDAQYKDADKVLSAVQKESAYYLQSLYFRGVIALQENALDRAYPFFATVSETPAGSYFKYEQIRDLAVLALGRLLFQKGDLEAAADHYLKIEHRSHLFPEAYLELCWIYIKREQWEKALEALRLVRYIAPGSFVAPQAEILEGNILIKLRRYGEAMLLFNRIVKEYGDIRDQLNSLKGKANPWEDAEGSVESRFSLYAPFVRSLLKDNKKFSQAMRLQDELKQIEVELEQVAKLESKLTSIVGNKNVASIFPPLKEGTEKTIVLKSRVVALRAALLKTYADAALKGLASQDRARWDELEKERKVLEKKVSDLMPQAGASLEEAASHYAASLLAFEEELHRALVRTRTLGEQIEALQMYCMRAAASPDDRVVKKIETEKQQIASLRERILKLKQETEDEKNRLLLGGDIFSRITIARDAYERTLREQEQLLARSTSLPATEKKRVEDLFSRLDKLAGTVDRLSERLNEVVGGLVQNIKEAFDAEKIKIEEYKSQLLSLKREANETASLTIVSNLSRVNKTFDDLLLQADLGIIDVAWERKEEATQNLNRLRTRMAQEIQELYLNLENLE